MYSIQDFVDKYCEKYNIKEDDFTTEDVIFIEDCWYAHATTGELPDFLRKNNDLQIIKSF